MTKLEITGRGLLVAYDQVMEAEGPKAAANLLQAVIQGKRWMLQGYLVKRLGGSRIGTAALRVYRNEKPGELAHAAREAAALVRDEANNHAEPDEQDTCVRWRIELAAQELELIADAAELLARSEATVAKAKTVNPLTT